MKKKIKEWIISTIIAVVVVALIVGVLMFPKISLGVFAIVVLILFIVFIKYTIFKQKLKR